jgi:hypothetical protein
MSSAKSSCSNGRQTLYADMSETDRRKGQNVFTIEGDRDEWDEVDYR